VSYLLIAEIQTEDMDITDIPWMIWDIVLANVLNNINLKHCKVCNARSFMYTMETAHLSFVINPRQFCTKERLLSSAFQCQNTTSELNVKISSTKSITFTFRCIDSRQTYKRLYDLRNFGSKMCHAVSTSKIYNCPRVILSTNEHNITLTRHLNSHSLAFYRYSPNEFFVCTENYIIPIPITSSNHLLKQTISFLAVFNLLVKNLQVWTF